MLDSIRRPGDINVDYLGRTVDVGGRITSVRSHGAVCFVDLTWDGQTIQIVANGDLKARRLDLAIVRASVVMTGDRVELRLVEILDLQAPVDRVSAGLQPLRNAGKGTALRTRAILESAARGELEGRGFIPVRSPGIVGDWVRGQTGAFELTYYGNAAFLTISNMLCHQMLLGSGFSRVYELGPIYREEHPSSRHRLAEFTILDIGMSFAGIDQLFQVVEATLDAICVAVAAFRPDILVPDVPSPIPRIEHAELLGAAGLEATSGSQLPVAARRWLAEEFPGFVWVVGFPEHTRPFFVRAVDGTCVDGQLWYQGRIYLAAGGERETNLDEIRRRIKSEGKDIGQYDFFMEHLGAGLPPSVGIGMGIERFLAAVITGAAVDYAAFPHLVGRSGQRAFGGPQ